MSCQNRKRSLGKTGSRCMPPPGVAIAAWRSAGSMRTASPDYINIERDERAAAEVLRINRGMHSVPTIVFPDGSILVEPRARELAATCLQEPEPSLGERLKRLYKSAVRRES